MNREEVRKLIGGYATGSLTPEEQKLLFDAALDDQALFDELMAEQDLKDIIDQPGARDRLLQALQPEPVVASTQYSPHARAGASRVYAPSPQPAPRWYRRPATWAASGAIAAALALIAILPRAFRSDTPPAVEIAQTREADAPKLGEPEPASPARAAVKPPLSGPLPRQRPPAAPVPAPAVTGTASSEARKATSPDRAGEREADAVAPVAAPAPVPAAPAEVAGVAREEKESQNRSAALGGRVTSMRAAKAAEPAPQAAAAVLSQVPAAVLSYEVDPKEGFTPGRTVRITARAAGGGSVYLFRKSPSEQWTRAGEGRAPVTFQVPTSEADRQLEFRLVYSPAPIANAASVLVEGAKKSNELRDAASPASALVLPIVIRARP
ncbi:MAG: hypothetical protein K2X35_21310 [Bryobacteraceae bacterium]|nr:hypothetical protein [Bryobacteraceae bacterium]